MRIKVTVSIGDVLESTTELHALSGDDGVSNTQLFDVLFNFAECDLYFYYCWLSKMDVNVDGWQEQEANESEKYVEEQIIDMTIAMYLY